MSPTGLVLPGAILQSVERNRSFLGLIYLSYVGPVHSTQRNTNRIICCLLSLMCGHAYSVRWVPPLLPTPQPGWQPTQRQKARRSWGSLCFQQIPWSLLVLLLMQRNFWLFCQQLFPSRLIWAPFQWANSNRGRDPSDTKLKQITHWLLPFQACVTEGLQSTILAQPQGDKHVRWG